MNELLTVPTARPLPRRPIVRPYVLDAGHKDARWLNRVAGAETDSLALAVLLEIATPVREYARPL